MLFRIQTGAGANGRTVDFPVDANSMQMMREARTSTVAGAFTARFGTIDASLPSVLGTLPRTGLAEGLARTIAFHRDAARALG